MMISYRLMQSRDVAGVFKVDQACFSHNWTEDSYQAETKNILSNYIVAEVDGEIIGFGGFWQVLDEAHITNIAVRETYRQTGVGQRIMNAMLALALEKGCVGMTLEVRGDNQPAINFYLKNKFTREGRRKDYYGTGMDGIIMWRYGLE
ncbi:ribosomal protein S18-alanine N-acetyltransferase [Acetobacterium sp.]|jgi:ribosomal-protein-alanine N-acetyltransferase|uniref:ribosomal protein S18-alanine N-acetyltransferase n=1 Tax=Acetobacterium sp. TaxID=1872094 RepID=UPI000CC77170|nr:ribosomal protein S18-alanine N-acetyltransferase [Acetobacterium sp.]MDO9492280.1 ribosomal protein S18-alanine N-acetyltransferase [Acetobacterium sp.]PKM71193.1 MAG: ribosomal-protein-alanine N-acetyltransferase [Firmicutes bacterium HGW-Firmicutes-17]